ncbi:MAG: UDP-glucose 4-epimerase GalE [Chitinophagales bacterium]|nr:UDP-glucose 4-epimerase GalE [Chitinophagales bacterium]MCB9019613.1 UDP-glucose 4-epimerase GalE [Chitinophagales bacterium]MCB9022815.1 UDP-glucose 4-epimerase GalE [Chitinophagales bacterium]HPE97541.1 UDP-glucose 4-epimerase GalE [Chitinophagales bacterium]HRX24015.1 UDP-glucose 4-epimerase GalE [Chitinophagales bacterium]
MKTCKVLVTGGCGYIGSHTAIDLLKQGFEVVSIDSLERSQAFVAGRVEEISGKPFHQYSFDCRDEAAVRKVFEQHPDISGVIHFAAYKSVGESVEHPLRYFDNNLNSLITVLRVAESFHVQHFVFSSSCSVYGNAASLPVTESTPLAEPESPYGRTKLMSEQIIHDYSLHSRMRFTVLRYFNPAGAHDSGRLGEIPFGKPDNLVPVITETAIGKRPALTVYGDDYPTRDGSCLRDYIHVMDIASAHTKALQYLLENKQKEKVEIFNLGSGEGITVLEMIHAFEKVSATELNYLLGDKRPGDVIAIYADNSKARSLLGWTPVRTTEDIMRSAWAWENRMREEKIK